jgi:ABC-type transport system involved in multi-copper enzyme maturation permease subunit
MTESQTVLHARDLVSVGSRVSWGAIAAGSVLALGITFLLAPVGGAVGLSLTDRVSEDNLRLAAVGWPILVMCVAVFVGGVVASVFTVGENKTEAMIYGILTWALTIFIVMALAGAGVRSGFVTVIRIHEFSQSPSEAELATRISWIAFAGAWASMFAGALGGLVGAGPTFRIVKAPPSQPLM